MSKVFLAKVAKIIDPLKFVIEFKAKGIVEDAKAYPISETDEPSIDDEVLIHTLETTVSETFLWQRIKVNEFSRYKVGNATIEVHGDDNDDPNCINIFTKDTDENSPYSINIYNLDSDDNLLNYITLDSGGISIHSGGDITVSSNSVIVSENSMVTPTATGKGPFCGIPFCPFTGAAHTGNVISSNIIPKGE